MSDRKCKSAGATDTQPRVTRKGRGTVRNRSEGGEGGGGHLRCPSPFHGYIGRYILSLSRKYIYTEIPAHYALANELRALSELSRRVLNSAEITPRSSRLLSL